MAVRTAKIPVTLTGATGSAQSAPINGEIQQIHIVYSGQSGATCDVTIATLGSLAPAFTILTISNNDTDGVYRPHYIIHNESGTALTGTAGGDRHAPFVDDHLTVAVAGAAAGTVTVYIIYTEC